MSENENGLIMLTADDGSEEAFFVLEKADIAGVSYLLVTDSVEDEEAEAMILREETEDELVTYQVVGRCRIKIRIERCNKIEEEKNRGRARKDYSAWRFGTDWNEHYGV